MTNQPEPDPTTATTTSTDGTVLGFHRVGQGPPIVVVHGSISTADSWLPVASALASAHTVYVLDRRGRGLTGDAESYSLTTEADDIKAVLAVAQADTGIRPALLGHSYGAICCLEAVRDGADIAALVLYEPPLPVDGPVAGEQLEPYANAIAAGDHDRAMRIAAEHFLRISAEETEGLAATPLWADFLALTPTWTRELAEIDKSVAVLEQYGALDVPTLLLVGGVSPGHLVGASEYLDDRLPNATKVVFAGQTHFAHYTAPAEVAQAITAFLQHPAP